MNKNTGPFSFALVAGSRAAGVFVQSVTCHNYILALVINSGTFITLVDQDNFFADDISSAMWFYHVTHNEMQRHHTQLIRMHGPLNFLRRTSVSSTRQLFTTVYQSINQSINQVY